MSKAQPEHAKSLDREHDHLGNVNLSIQWNRWILKAIGVWPKAGDVSPIERYLTWLINALCYSLLSFLFVPCLTYLILEVKDVYNRIRMIGPLIFFSVSITKYYLLILHKDYVRNCLRQIKWDWKNIDYQDEKRIMTVKANHGRRLIIICSFFMFIAYVFYYVVIPISMGRIVDEDTNSTFIPMPFPFSIHIADYRRSPLNEIFFSCQLLAGVLLHIITVGACSLAASFATHACGQMDVMMNWLKYLVDGRKDMCGTVDGRIACIVDQHVRILKFLGLTEKALQQISFAEFMGCTMNLCFLGYYAIREWNPKQLAFSLTYLTLITSFGFNIFIFCYIGELVAEKCRRISEMSYMIEWHRLAGKKKLCCILIMAMANSSTKLTAGNMVELSISTFSNVVKSAVGYLNMLKALA